MDTAPGPRNADHPFLVALNLTRRCNLACAHCYLDADQRGTGKGELSTAEVKALLADIQALSDETMIVLTGGEPLLRRDLDELARHAGSLGLMVVVGTNGMALDPARVERLRKAGVAGVGISLDSLDSEHHDAFRGLPGAWKRTMRGIDACRAGGLSFQLHFSVTDGNAHELDEMIAFARSSGALVLNIFFLVCTGRGEKFTGISRDTYAKVLRRVTKAAYEEPELLVRAKCAPHFKRMAIELDPAWPITSAQGYDAGGCLAGTRYCRVTPEGEVTPCPYMEVSAGSFRERSFGEIWRQAPLFDRLRAPELQGRCGVCEYRKLCGGCRARPMARDGDLMGEDFMCDYEPRGGAVIQPMPERESSLAWTAEAEDRLSHVPAFLRRMIRNRVDAQVRKQNRQSVTAEDIHALARRRFGGSPRRPGKIPGEVPHGR